MSVLDYSTPDRLRALAAEAKRGNAHKSVKDFVAWRLTKWAMQVEAGIEPPDSIETAVADSHSAPDTFERNFYERALNLVRGAR